MSCWYSRPTAQPDVLGNVLAGVTSAFSFFAFAMCSESSTLRGRLKLVPQNDDVAPLEVGARLP